MNKLARAVNSLEHRNIKAIEMVTNERTADIENTRRIYLATNRKSPGDGLKQAGDRSGLPSLVNIAQCTSEKVFSELIHYGLLVHCFNDFAGSWWSSWPIGNETLVAARLQSSCNSTTGDISFASIRPAAKFTECDTI